jgi:hypothetical protein
MDLASRRLSAQGLLDPGLAGPLEVVERLLALQAQDPRGARLAIRSRLPESTKDPGASMVDRELNAGALVTGWLNRGTLHMVRSDDYHWLRGLTNPRQETSNLTRLKQEGVSEEQARNATRLICQKLGHGPSSRVDLKELLESNDIPVTGQALVHILFFASLQGKILRGPVIGTEQAFVLAEDWLPPAPRFDADTALAELARRFLTGHGPATDRDLAKWAGVSLGQARSGLKLIRGKLEEQGLVDLKSRPSSEGEVTARLLGAFDPVLHGWESRDWLIPRKDVREVVTSNGIFRPTIMVGNRLVGTWAMPGGRVELKPFGRLGRSTRDELEADAERVVDFLGG